MRRDQSGTLFVAPIQGDTAKRQLDAELRESLATVVYQRPEGEVLLRSDAVLQALVDIGSRWRFLARPALWIPRRWRDGVYNWVAARRKKFFGNDACSLPSAEESERILP